MVFIGDPTQAGCFSAAGPKTSLTMPCVYMKLFSWKSPTNTQITPSAIWIPRVVTAGRPRHETFQVVVPVASERAAEPAFALSIEGRLLWLIDALPPRDRTSGLPRAAGPDRGVREPSHTAQVASACPMPASRQRSSHVDRAGPRTIGVDRART